MSRPELSVIIPTLNRGRLFHDTVRQVLKQRRADFDLWLIDQSDPDQRAANEALVAELDDARVHYLHLVVKGLPNARNEGLARAKGRIVLFLDDDVILLDEGFLAAHVAPYADASIGGVTGRIVARVIPRGGSASGPGGRVPGDRLPRRCFALLARSRPRCTGAVVSCCSRPSSSS